MSAAVQNPPAFRAVGWMLGHLLKAWGQRIDYVYHDRSGHLDPKTRTRPVIYACWHDQIIGMPSAWRRACPHDHARVLTSASRHGTLLASAMRAFDIESIRGSSARKKDGSPVKDKRGGIALKEMLTCLRRHNTHVCITPDGPKGPKHQIDPGILHLAAISGAPIQPITLQYNSRYLLPTWDRMQVPRLNARADVTLGAQIYVPRGADTNEIAAISEELRQTLLATT